MEHDRLDEFMTLIVGASRSVTRLKGTHMAIYGLGSTHTMCVRMLNTHEKGLTRTQLAAKCELDKAQVSRIVNELSEKKYVYESSEKSSYKRKIILTEEGKSIANDINRIVLEINSFVSGDISDGDIEVFYKVFKKICTNLKIAEENTSVIGKEADHG